MLNSRWIRGIEEFLYSLDTDLFHICGGTDAQNSHTQYYRFWKGTLTTKDFFPLRRNIPYNPNSLDVEIPKVPFVAHLDPKGSRERFQILGTCTGQLLFQPGFPTVQKTSGMGGGESQTGGGSSRRDDLELKLGIHNTETSWESTDIEKLEDLEL